MRHLLSIFLLTTTSVSFAQPYIPFPTNDANWRYRQIEYWSGNHLIMDHLYIMTGQDTTIQGFTYKKIIRRTHIDTLNVTQPFPAIANVTANVPDIFYAGVRENNKIVYYYPYWSIAEDTAYDFNTLGSVASSVDSILVNSAYRIRYNYSIPPTSPEFVVEGIGYLFGFLPGVGSNGQNIVDFHCFFTSNFSYSPDSIVCTVVNEAVSIGNLSVNDNINIYPNPFSDKLNIKGAHGDVLVYDAIGRKVITEKIKDQSNDISATHLSPGMYFAVLRNEKGETVYRQKLVKD
jgi:hypothetical protein